MYKHVKIDNDDRLQQSIFIFKLFTVTLRVALQTNIRQWERVCMCVWGYVAVCLRRCVCVLCMCVDSPGEG